MRKARRDLIRLFGPLDGAATLTQRLRALALKCVALEGPRGPVFVLAWRDGKFGEIEGERELAVEFTPAQICDLVAAGLVEIKGRKGRAVAVPTKAGIQVAAALVAAARAKEQGKLSDQESDR